MELLYNNTSPILPNTTPTYNGNISAAIWQTVQPTGTTTPVTTGVKSYKYAYDNLNRLLSGVFTGNTAQNENYSEYIDVSTMVPGTKPYDLNGNILTLRRYGKRNNAFNTIDELTYTYDGNRLKAVQDVVATDNGGDFYESGTVNATVYTYDANGNLTKDDNKKIISITYNHLNLPATINKTGGNRIVYTYDAAGNKVRQDYYINGTITKTTDFIGNFVYENGLPSCIVYDEGRVVYANNSRTYFGEIYLKDHLGNVRIACRRENGVLKTRQVDSYYPFGMNIKGLTANSTDVNRPNEYLYNGKMMQDEMGLNWLDYGARFFDAVLGRWHHIDDKAEKYSRASPYNYALNNPIKFVDIDGKDVVILVAKDGAGGMGHMSAIIQDGNGNWYYMTQGAADPNGNISNMSSGGVQGGMSLVPLGTKDKNEAIAKAKQDQNNSPYSDQVELNTSTEMDANIFESAQEQQKQTNSGEKKYKLLTNNCVDAVQDPIAKGTGVKLPKDIDPRPNKYFAKLQKNQEKVQKKIDKQVQKQEKQQKKKEDKQK